MSSEIGNKEILKRVANFLKILDVKQFASMLKTDEVIPTVNIAPDLAGEYESGAPERFPIVGLTTLQLDIVNATDTGCFNDEGDADRKIMAAFFDIEFTGSPPIGARITWEWRLLHRIRNISVPVQVCNWAMGFFGNSEGGVSPSHFHFPLGGWAGSTGIIGDPDVLTGMASNPLWWNGIVPAGWDFGCLVTYYSDALPWPFPADTFCSFSAAAIKVPRGVAFPN